MPCHCVMLGGGRRSLLQALASDSPRSLAFSSRPAVECFADMMRIKWCE